MITQGQASLLHTYVNSFIGCMLVGCVAGGFGLMIWQTAFEENPIANAMVKLLYQQQALTLTAGDSTAHN